MASLASRRGASGNPLAAVFFIVLSTLIGFACSDGGGTTVIKLAHGLDVSRPVHVAMVRMGEIVAEDSGGSVRIDVYPSEQLGTERECVDSADRIHRYDEGVGERRRGLYPVIQGLEPALSLPRSGTSICRARW